jgi:hypothetical protein
VYHQILFLRDVKTDLESSPQEPLERTLLRRGSSRRAQLRPYVVEAGDELTEVADLFFDDGTGVRRVPFACFTFLG